MIQGYIYALVDPISDRVRYIGQTTQSLEKRLAAHKYHARNPQTHKDWWIRSLEVLGKSPEIAAICITGEQSIDALEVSAIKAARQNDWHLTNIAAGGKRPPPMKGEDNGRAILIEADVVNIRKQYANDDITLRDLADRYGVERSTVFSIVTGKNWPEAGGPISETGEVRGENHGLSVLTEDEVYDMRVRYHNGEIDHRGLAKESKASRHTIALAVRGKTWKHVGGPLTEREYVLSNNEKEEVRYRFANGASKDELCAEYDIGRRYLINVLKGKVGTRAGGPLIKPMAMSGEDHPTAKLTERDVLQIRTEYRDKRTPYRELAKQYGVIHATIGTIVRGQTWPDADGPIKGVDY